MAPGTAGTRDTTGIQVAQLGLIVQLEALREQMTPPEYIVVVDLVGGWVDVERKCIRFSLRRWAA